MKYWLHLFATKTEVEDSFLFLWVTKNMIHMTDNRNSEFDFYVQSKFDRRHYNQKQKSSFMCDVSNQKSFMDS
jgi:hypothetical protein